MTFRYNSASSTALYDVSTKLVFVYRTTSLHSLRANTLEASCTQEATSQSIAEQQTDPKHRFFVTLHNSHNNVSTLRLNFDGTFSDFNEKFGYGVVEYFWKTASVVNERSCFLSQRRFNYF